MLMKIDVRGNIVTTVERLVCWEPYMYINYEKGDNTVSLKEGFIYNII